MSSNLVVRRVVDSDRFQIKEFLTEHWGDSRLLNSNSEHEASELPGFIVYQEGFIVGLLTYAIDGDSCELVTINSTMTASGIGSMLLRSLEYEVMQEGCKRIWAMTTNDNMLALRFYQKRGYDIKAVYRNSIEALRLKKPTIPVVGEEGILVVSEIEVEKLLDTV